MPLHHTDITPSLTGDGVPSGPPAEVLADIAVAWASCERLEAAGRRLHFDLRPADGRLTVELTDRHGAPLGPVSPGRVLAIAAGDLTA